MVVSASVLFVMIATFYFPRMGMLHFIQEFIVFLKRLKMELPYETAIPFLGIYLETAILWKDTRTLQHC